MEGPDLRHHGCRRLEAQHLFDHLPSVGHLCYVLPRDQPLGASPDAQLLRLDLHMRIYNSLKLSTQPGERTLAAWLMSITAPSLGSCCRQQEGIWPPKAFSPLALTCSRYLAALQACCRLQCPGTGAGL